MSQNFYSEINLHIVWHTINSMPLLKPVIEASAYRFVRRRIAATPGVFLHEIGGIPNHVHIAATIPPTLTISEFVGQLKGGVSHDVNHEAPSREARLQWQTGYGVVSFGTKDLPWVKEYIQNQKQHHDNNHAQECLERITQLDA